MTTENHTKSNRDQDFELLSGIFRETASVIGEDFLHTMSRGLALMLDAETCFVAQALDSPPTRARVLAGWRGGDFAESWDYDLTGNPCMLSYNGEATLIPCDVRKDFPGKTKSEYESYIGIPLNDPFGNVIGHIAIYARRARDPDDFALELARLCGLRAEAEVQRLVETAGEREELNSLRRSATERTDLLAVASHELRAPLASVIGTLGAIESGVFGPLEGQIADYVSDASTAIQQMLKMADDILDETRISEIENSIDRKDINVKALSDQIVSSLAGYAEQAKVTIDDSRIDEALIVKGDAFLLERLLGNLLTNAIKFSPEGETVSISTDMADDKIHISVIDNGPGIAKEYHQHIFERFSQAPGATSKNRKGSGLGLSIAMKVAKAHGGDLTVHSSPGHGSRFTAIL